MKKFLLLLFLMHFWYSIAQRPNIVWISCEDMSPRLGCYGDFTVPTPNIDRLAREGERYTNVFTCAGVCAPSRNAIVTGRIQTSNGGHNMRTLTNTYPEKTGLPKEYSIVMPPDVKHFSELLRADGYYCTNNAKTDYQFEDIPTIWDDNSNKAHWKNRAPNQPFFAVFNNNGTHESQIWARSKAPLRISPDKVKIPPYYPDTDTVRLDVARLYTNISEMDDWVGNLIKELEDAGLYQNTIIMFWSDHGDGLPFVKREIIDRGLRIPFIVKSIGTATTKPVVGAVNPRLISSIDWAPTVLSLAGIKTPSYMQGKAFLGKYSVKNPNLYVFAARDRMHSEYDRVRSVHDGRYQYVYNFEPEKPRYMDIAYRNQQASMREIVRMRDLGELNEIQMQWFLPTKPQEELYDIQSDPHQFTNLASNPKYSKELARFRKVFQNWQNKVPDMGAIPEKELLKQMWQGKDQPHITFNPELIERNGKIIISCSTEGASIAYKIIKNKGLEPKRWEVYGGPFVLPKGAKVKALAQRIGYQVSQVVVNN